MRKALLSKKAGVEGVEEDEGVEGVEEDEEVEAEKIRFTFLILFSRHSSLVSCHFKNTIHFLPITHPHEP